MAGFGSVRTGTFGGYTTGHTMPTMPYIPPSVNYPSAYIPNVDYDSNVDYFPQYRESAPSTWQQSLNPFSGGGIRSNSSPSSIYAAQAAQAEADRQAAIRAAKAEQVAAQKAQIAATQQALAQAAAQDYSGSDYGGGGGYYGGGGYSGGGYYGGGGGGYSGGYSSSVGGNNGIVTVGGLPVGDLTSKVSGWASRYLPGMYSDILANPGTIGRDTIKDLGVGGEALQGKFGELSSFLASQLLPIFYFQTAMGKIPKGGDVINRLHDTLKNMATPNGEEIDPMKLLDTVLGEGSKSSKAKQTLGSALFAGMTPAQQGETMQGLLNNISNWLTNPYFAQAMRNWASVQKDNYISAAASATNTYKDPFATYLKATALPE